MNVTFCREKFRLMMLTLAENSLEASQDEDQKIKFPS